MTEQLDVQTIHQPYADEWYRIDSAAGWQYAALFARWKAETRASDMEIGAIIGISKQNVNAYRRVWEDFSDQHGKATALSFNHYKSAISWDDADEWIRRAKREKMTVQQMVMARQIQIAAASAPKDEELDEPDFLPQADDEPGCTDDLPEDHHSTTVHTPPQSIPDKPAERRTDKAGKDLPPRLRDTFEKGSRLESPCKLLAAVWKELESILEDTPQWANPVLHNRKTIIQKYIENAKAELAFSTPFAVCPACGGDEPKCKVCNGTGWTCAENYRKVVK